MCVEVVGRGGETVPKELTIKMNELQTKTRQIPTYGW